MRNLYIILTVIGWIWTAAFFIAWGANELRRKRQASANQIEAVKHE